LKEEQGYRRTGRLASRGGWHNTLQVLKHVSTVKAVEDELREAIRFHVAGLKEDGLGVPEPTSIADYVEA
jgi:hypothetical protein